jgi:hypothetical protein
VALVDASSPQVREKLSQSAQTAAEGEVLVIAAQASDGGPQFHARMMKL